MVDLEDYFTPRMSTSTGLTAREAIIETLNRFAAGLDDNDEALLQSVFSEESIFDATPMNKLGFTFSPMHGKQVVIDALMKAVGSKLDTMHHASNFLVDIKGDEAELKCYALAQHFRLGEGLSSLAVGSKDCFLQGNRWNVDLVREEGGPGGGWKIRKFVLVPGWTFGNAEVMKG